MKRYSECALCGKPFPATKRGKPRAPGDHYHYPFCTMRCGFDYGATMALGADINAVRERKGGAS